MTGTPSLIAAPRHGADGPSNNAYLRGCRCSECLAAHAEHQREWVRSNPEAYERLRKATCPSCGGKMTRGNGSGRDPAMCIDCTQEAIAPPHGTISRYTSTKWRCRCDECRAVNTAYHRQYLQRRKAVA